MKKLVLFLALTLLFAFSLSACSSGDSGINEVNVMNGSNTESIGSMTQAIVPEKDVTDEYINNWYKQIKDKGSNYDIIVFEESINGDKAKGVYHMGGGVIYKNVEFEKSSDGSYVVSNMDNAIDYTVSE